MTRISAEKIIKETEEYERLYPIYSEIIGSLESMYPVTEDPQTSEYVNFKLNNVAPKHSWFKYKEGYSSQMVEHILKNSPPAKDSVILDPFCGVGTTNVVAQQNGYESIGFDINPVAILAARVKTENYSETDIRHILNALDTVINEKVPFRFIDLPRVIENSFTSHILIELLKLKRGISSIHNDVIKDFINLAFVSIIEDCSLRIKDGNGIKLKKNKSFLKDPAQALRDKVNLMLEEVRGDESSTRAKIVFGSSLTDIEDKVEDGTIGLSVFSPPYANCFDYLEVYKLEVWLGGFADEYQDFGKFRDKAMRSHVNSKFDHTVANQNLDVQVIADLLKTFNLWNKNIPGMVKGYFDDITNLLRSLYPKLTTDGSIHIVVANSVYKGVIVPTDLLIASIAGKIGFNVDSIIKARRIRSSSQQLVEIRHNELMRESIIHIRK
jgi:hypothetical protein